MLHLLHSMWTFLSILDFYFISIYIAMATAAFAMRATRMDGVWFNT